MPSRHQPEWTPPALPGLALIRAVGSGAFGDVWLARHQTLDDRLRAVKVVRRAAFATTSAFQEEFRGLQLYQEISRESQYLVSIYQVGHEDDFYYYEMELADDLATGEPCRAADDDAISAYVPETLTARVRHRPDQILPISECAHLGCAMAEALRCLHDEGFTHRDVKPDNIIYIKGVPRLADIGTMAHAETRRSIEALGYTPAEGPGQPRADIFSLGRTLFFASSGNEPLYHFGSYPEAYYAQDLHDRKRLESIIDQAVRHSVKARYGSIHAMRRDLESVAPVRVRSRYKLGLSAAIVGSVGVAAFLLWLRESPPPAPTPQAVLAPIISAEPAETSLRVLVVSRNGRNVKQAEVCAGTHSYAVNWNDADRWQMAESTLTVSTETPLYLSVRAPGYIPQDVPVLELHDTSSMPHLVNVALAPKPGGVVLSPAVALFERGGVQVIEAASDGHFMLDPERTFSFDVIDPNRHAVQPWDLFVEPGVFYELPGVEVREPSQPVFDSRVRAPWENSLGMRFVNVPGPYAILWAQYETRLIDFRAFCEDTGRDVAAFETDLWDAAKSDHAFFLHLDAADQARYAALTDERDRAVFIENHTLPSERKARLQHPVTKVSLTEIRDFAEWLTARERAAGRLSDDVRYRLPLDVEWSAATGLEEAERLTNPMRSGLTLLNLVEAEVLTREELRTRAFRMANLSNVIVDAETLESFAPDTQALIRKAVARQQLNMRIDRAYHLPTAYVEPGKTHVASKDTVMVSDTAPNAWGLYGLSGNVSEVLHDSFEFYQLVLRGPSFHTVSKANDPSSVLNLRARMLAPKDVRNLSFGFRLVLAASDS